MNDCQRLLVATAAVLLGACSSVPEGAPLSIPTAEIQAYQASRTTVPGLRNLHDEKGPWLDGVKGRWAGRTIFDPVYEALPTGIANEIEQGFHSLGCNVPLIAVGTAIGSQAFLIDDKRSIATATRLRIEQVVKAPAGVVPGSMVDVILAGGEVLDDGELLRMTADDSGPPMIASQRYLLLGQQRGPLGGTAAYTTGLPIRVASGMLYPEGVPDRRSPVNRNMPLRWFEARLAEVLAKAPCPVRSAQ